MDVLAWLDDFPTPEREPHVAAALIRSLEDRIAEALEYCDDRADVNDSPRGIAEVPNDFMRVAQILRGEL